MCPSWIYMEWVKTPPQMHDGIKNRGALYTKYGMAGEVVAEGHNKDIERQDVNWTTYIYIYIHSN